jgi:hypothetical protein
MQLKEPGTGGYRYSAQIARAVRSLSIPREDRLEELVASSKALQAELSSLSAQLTRNPHSLTGEVTRAHLMDMVRNPGADVVGPAAVGRQKGSTPPIPPAGETVLWYICSPDRLEVVLGDLEEKFLRRAATSGSAAARNWYWWQVARTALAFGLQIIVKLALLRGILEKLGIWTS